MLPKGFNLDHLDDGVRELVINLNRIKDLNTLTTCEGHIWRDCPAWPTKDGWVHFTIPGDSAGDYGSFLSLVRDFCASKDFFNLEGPRSCSRDNSRSVYTIHGCYEPHHDEGEDLFERMNSDEREAYFRRADSLRLEILQGWRDLNLGVVGYLMERHGENFSQLNYIES